MLVDVRRPPHAGECLRHPGDREVDVAVGELRLRHDLDAAFEDLDVDALILVEALIDGGEVAGELRLDEPLQLQLDRLGDSHTSPSAGSVDPAAVVARARSVAAGAGGRASVAAGASSAEGVLRGRGVVVVVVTAWRRARAPAIAPAIRRTFGVMS